MLVAKQDLKNVNSLGTITLDPLYKRYMFSVLFYCEFYKIMFVLQGVLPKGRVFGGGPAAEGEFPYMASLQFEGYGHVCGASVIDSQWVLTSAQCIVKKYKTTKPIHRSTSIHPIILGSPENFSYNLAHYQMHHKWTKQSM